MIQISQRKDDGGSYRLFCCEERMIVMPDWFLGFTAVVALVGGIFGAVNGYRSMKRSSPTEEIKKENMAKWKAFYSEKWDKIVERVDIIEDAIQHVDSERTRRRFEEIDSKLDNDNRRIGVLIETTKSQQRFLVLLLKAQQQSLAHLSDGNHKIALKQVSDEIQDFLLNEATRCDL